MVFQNKFLNKPQVTEKNILESEVEGSVKRYAKSKGVIVDKFTSPSKRSVPDDIFTFPPHGWVVFIEFKKPGKKPTEKQALDHEKRRAVGAHVFVVDNVAYGKRIIDYYLGDRDAL
jgi:hypothetical protein